MSLITAYFDESGTHDGAPFFVIAGYVFERENACKFDDEWRVMLDKHGCTHMHMNDLQQLKGPHSHQDDNDADLMAREAIRLIKLYAARGLAFSIAEKDLKLVQAASKNFIATPYTFLCWHALVAVRRWIRDNVFEGDAAYIFETGAPGHKEADGLMTSFFEDAKLKKKHRYRSHTFEDKTQSTQLQAADMLAWLWNNYCRKKAAGRPIRPDFTALVDLENVYFAHFDEKHLMWLTNKFNSAEKGIRLPIHPSASKP